MMREVWIHELTSHLEKLHPGLPEYSYFDWATEKLDRELASIGDFLSLNWKEFNRL